MSKDEAVEVMAREVWLTDYWEGLTENSFDQVWASTKHDGDCTGRCHTCFLCLKHELIEVVDAALTALITRYPAIGEIVENG